MIESLLAPAELVLRRERVSLVKSPENDLLRPSDPGETHRSVLTLSWLLRPPFLSASSSGNRLGPPGEFTFSVVESEVIWRGLRSNWSEDEGRETPE